jgi:ferritin
VQPEFTTLPAPKGDFKSLLEAAQHAQAMEQGNTRGVNACYAAALQEQDFPAQVLLHWFVNEQVEEEDWADEMVERVERASCAGALNYLDRHIEKYLTDSSVNAAALGN